MAAATLLDLQSAITDGGLRNRIEAALCGTAIAINFEDPATTNHTNRFNWISGVLKSNLVSAASQVQSYVVAAYNADHPTDDLATLLAMTDVQVQNYCNAAANVFAGLS